MTQKERYGNGQRTTKIAGIQWKGTNREKPDLSEQVETQERKIAQWILYGKEEYPWETTHRDKE